MKVSSKIEICNLALARIEQNSISSYENDMTVQGQKCRLVYEQAKSSLLESFNWTFATRTAELTLVEKTTTGDYLYKYALPEGFLRLISVYPLNYAGDYYGALNSNFILRDKYIYANFQNTKIDFIYDIDDVSSFSPLFIDCLVLDVAIRLTKIFNSSSTYLQELQVEFERAFAKAKESNNSQNKQNASILEMAIARIEKNLPPSNDTDIGQQYQKAVAIYEQAKRSLLGRYNWTFSIKNKKLEKQLNKDDLCLYKYKYPLPEYFLRLISVYNVPINKTPDPNHPGQFIEKKGMPFELIQVTGRRPPYVIMGKFIESDYEFCTIEYIEDVKDVLSFSPLFIDCLILDIAIRLSKIYNASAGSIQLLQMEFERVLAKAKETDCFQTMLNSIRSYPLLYSSWEF